MSGKKVVMTAPGVGRTYEMGRMRAVFKADGGESGDRFSISEWWLEPKTRGPGVHEHPEDHIFHVIEGTMSLFAGGEWMEAATGAYVVIPGGTPHDFQNRTDARAGFVSINVPGGFEERMPGIQEALSGEDLRLEHE